MHTAQLMPLPLTVCKIQIGFTFLVPAHPGSPVVCVCVCVFKCPATEFSVYDSNFTSFGSAVSARLPLVTNRQTDRQADRPRYKGYNGSNSPHLCVAMWLSKRQVPYGVCLTTHKLVTSRRLVSAGGRGYLRQYLLLVPVTSALLAFFPPLRRRSRASTSSVVAWLLSRG